MNSDTRDKLAKIIPRLASEHEGEVVGSVNAIRRVLEAAGYDFNDLAEALSASRPLSGTARYYAERDEKPSTGFHTKEGFFHSWPQVAAEILSRHKTVTKRYGGGFLYPHQLAMLERVRIGAEEGHVYAQALRTIYDRMRTAWEAQQADRKKRKAA